MDKGDSVKKVLDTHIHYGNFLPNWCTSLRAQLEEYSAGSLVGFVPTKELIKLPEWRS